MPGNPHEWQNSIEQQTHPGRARVAELVKANSQTVLDVGCGIGLDYKFYKDTSVEYLGVDVTPKFIAVAHERGVPTQITDALNLPFANESFDSVVCKDLLVHLPPGDWQRAFKEMVRVARKQIITLEDSWADQTKISLCEKYMTVDFKTFQPKELLFFNNVYGRQDMLIFASSLGLQVQVHPGVTHKTVVDGPYTFQVSSQITVYTKEA